MIASVKRHVSLRQAAVFWWNDYRSGRITIASSDIAINVGRSESKPHDVAINVGLSETLSHDILMNIFRPLESTHDILMNIRVAETITD